MIEINIKNNPIKNGNENKIWTYKTAIKVAKVEIAHYA